MNVKALTFGKVDRLSHMPGGAVVMHDSVTVN